MPLRIVIRFFIDIVSHNGLELEKVEERPLEYERGRGDYFCQHILQIYIWCVVLGPRGSGGEAISRCGSVKMCGYVSLRKMNWRFKSLEPHA